MEMTFTMCHLVGSFLSSLSNTHLPLRLSTDELKSHPPPFQPREDPADEADDEGDIYDIVEEVMQSQGQVRVLCGSRVQ